MTSTPTPLSAEKTDGSADPEFDRHRYAAELRLAIKNHGGEDAWFSMIEDSFVAVGRKDGAANVLVTAKGWQVQDLTDPDRSKIRVRTFDTAEDAVKAGKAVSG